MKPGFKKKGTLVTAVTCAAVIAAGIAVLANSSKLRTIFNPEDFERYENQYTVSDSYGLVAGDGEDTDLADQSDDGQDRSEGNTEAVETADNQPAKLDGRDDNSADSLGMAGNYDADAGRTNMNANAYAVTADPVPGSSGVNVNGGGGSGSATGGSGTVPGGNDGGDSTEQGGQDQETPDPTPSAVPTAAPTGAPTWEDEQLMPRDPIVTEYGELISLKASVPETWVFCLGDSFSEKDVTVTAAFRKDGNIIERTLDYGGTDGYSVSMSTQSIGSHAAIFYYMGMTARTRYVVLASGLSTYYYGNIDGNLYTFAFPGPVGADEGVLESLVSMGKSLYPTSGSVVDLTEVHSRMIAFLGDGEVWQSFQQNQQYKDVSFLEEGPDGYLNSMLTGFKYISGGVLEPDGPYLYYPVYDWGNRILKNVVNVIDEVPDGYKIRRTADGNADSVNYTGDQVLERYTGDSAVLQVPMGVTKVALTGIQGGGQKITAAVLPEGVQSLDAAAMAECLPDLEDYQVSGRSGYQVVDGVLYSGDGTVLLSVPAGKTEIREWPDSLEAIAEGAFHNSSIRSLTIPGTVKRLEKGCFEGLTAEVIRFEGVKAPESVADTGYKGKILVKDSANDTICKDWMFAFQNTEIIFGVMDQNGREISEKTGIYEYDGSSHVLVFTGYQEVLAGIPSGSYGRYVVPAGLSAIGEGAFAGCSGLVDIDVPETVTRLENNSLLLSDLVKTVTLHAEVTEAAPQIFGDPAGGAEVPEIIVYVPGEALAGYLAEWKKVLDPIYGAGTAEKLLKPAEDEFVYEGSAKYQKIREEDGTESYRLLKLYSSELTYFQVMDGTSEISSDAFDSCSALEIIYMPDSVNNVGNGALENCGSLSSVVSASGKLNLGGSDAFGPSGAGNIKIYEPGESYSSFLFDKGCIYGISSGAYTLLDVPSDHPGRLTVHENTVCLSEDACKDCQSITEIIFRDAALQLIGSRCFENCTGLETVDFTGLTRLEQMGDYVFRGCTGMSKLLLPDQLGEIGKGMCYGCTELAELCALGITSVGEEWFYQCQSLKSTSSYINADNLTDIGDRAFAYCTSFAGLTNIPNMRSIGSQAFMGCLSMKEVILPENLESMGEECFRDCVALESVELNGRLPAVSRYCFYGCRNLVKVEFSPQQKAALKVIGVQAFAQCTSLESMDFGDMKLLGQMGAETFEGCSFLTIVKMPESLEQVPDRCFAGCNNLSILTLLSTGKTTELGDHVFGDELPPFTHVWVGENVLQEYGHAYRDVLDGTYGEGTTEDILGAIDDRKEIIRGVTYELTEGGGRILTEVSPELAGNYTVLQDTVKIGDEAFKNCTKLTGIILPNDSTISLGNRCFQGCTALSDVVLSGDIPEWGEETFAGCTSIQAVYLGSDSTDHIERIGTRAFQGCTGLAGNSAVSIRATVTVMGEECFAGCSELMGIPMTDTFRAGLVEIEDSAFEGCTGLATLLTTKFTGLKKIGARAFKNCDTLKQPSIPANVESIGEECFSECDSLMYVSFYCGLEEFPRECFKNCPKLIRTGGTAAAFAGLKRIGEGAYENCTSLAVSSSWSPERYTNLEGIGDNAFKGCAGLTEVKLSGTVTEIGNNAFDGCSSLISLTLGSLAPPSIGRIDLGSLSSEFVILVPDSLDTGDSVYKDYLAVLSGTLGEENAGRILDSVTDGAKDRNQEKRSLEEELNANLNPDGIDGYGESGDAVIKPEGGRTEPGTGGATTEAGGTEPGTGGATEAGGTEPGTGGEATEAGGTEPEIGEATTEGGGTEPGAGGEATEAGGTEPGTGEV